MNHIEIIQRILKKKFILIFTFVFMLIAAGVSLLTPEEYQVNVSFVTNSTEGANGSSNRLSGLASLAGINLSSGSSQEILSPFLYPKLVRSTPFQKAVLYKPLSNSVTQDSLTYFDFSDNYMRASILGLLKKYTIGLPNLLFGSKKGEDSGNGESLGLTLKEKEKIDALRQRLTLNVNEIDGVLTLTCEMQDPELAFSVCQYATERLQSRITNIKLNRLAEKLKFTSSLLEEKKEEFEDVALRLAKYRDSNLSISTSVVEKEEQDLIHEYDLKFELYREVAKQQETQKINIQEESPSFTILEPAIYPIERFTPKRKLYVLAGGLLGIMLALMWTILIPFYHNLVEELKVKKVDA